MPSYNTTDRENDFNFLYPNGVDAVISELKEIANLTVDPNTTDLEKALDILGYAHGLFIHNGDRQPSANDPVTIIKEAKAGKKFRCVEYSLLGCALLWAYGIPSRVVGLKTSDVETREYGAGHVVVEFWTSMGQKWAMCDVQGGIIPSSEGVPLSALGLGDKVNQKLQIDYVPVSASRFASDSSFTNMEAYIEWVKEYLYFYDTPIEVTFEDIDRQKQKIAMLVPIGVKPPVKFQNMFKVNATYTQSVLDFYPKPLIKT